MTPVTSADRAAALSKLRIRADFLKVSAILLRVEARETGDAALLHEALALEAALGRLRERAGALAAGKARAQTAATDGESMSDGEAWGR